MEKFNSTKYKNDYAREKYDKVLLTMQKGKKSEIDEYRKQKGFKSLNEYINELIRRDMFENENNATKVINVESNETINM